MNHPELLQLGAVAVIFLFAIKEFFQWLKNRKNSNGQDVNLQLVMLNQKLDNHIQHIRYEIIEIKEDIREIKDKLLELRIKR